MIINVICLLLRFLFLVYRIRILLFLSLIYLFCLLTILFFVFKLAKFLMGYKFNLWNGRNWIATFWIIYRFHLIFLPKKSLLVNRLSLVSLSRNFMRFFCFSFFLLFFNSFFLFLISLFVLIYSLHLFTKDVFVLDFSLLVFINNLLLII